jgi:hypothetical protein
MIFPHDLQNNSCDNSKDGNPSIKSTRQMRTQVYTTQRQNKSKQSTKKSSKKIEQRPYAKRTHGYEMTINNNKKRLKMKNYHLPQIS